MNPDRSLMRFGPAQQRRGCELNQVAIGSTNVARDPARADEGKAAPLFDDGEVRPTLIADAKMRNAVR